SANFVGPTYTNLTAGSYTVVAVDNATSCQSARVVGVVNNNTFIPTINIAPVSQTNCDTTNPNGQLTASLDAPSVVADYTFTWYAGTATSGPSLATGTTATNLPAGTYTVVAQHNTSGCS